MFIHYVYGVQTDKVLSEALEASRWPKEFERHGWSPELWQAVRDDVRALGTTWEEHRRLWRDYHPNGAA